MVEEKGVSLGVGMPNEHGRPELHSTAFSVSFLGGGELKHDSSKIERANHNYGTKLRYES